MTSKKATRQCSRPRKDGVLLDSKPPAIHTAMLAVVDSFCQRSIVMPMTSMNISLPQELKDYIERQTKAGYSTPSEYLRELVREDQKRRAKERLDTLLLEGLDSGEALPATPAFWDELKREAFAKLGKK